jgi:hypothetical protein
VTGGLTGFADVEVVSLGLELFPCEEFRAIDDAPESLGPEPLVPEIFDVPDVLLGFPTVWPPLHPAMPISATSAPAATTLRLKTLPMAGPPSDPIRIRIRMTNSQRHR